LLVDGVTVIVATTGVVPALVAVNDAILPVPEAARPIEGVLFVHENVVPETALVKVTATVGLLLHTVWLEMLLTVGVGLTVMVKVVEEPEQLKPPFVNTGVTVIVAITGAEPALVAVNEAMLPAPDAARPIEVALFVQLYTVPGTGPVNDIAAVCALLQTVWLLTALTAGVGLTV
jgi:D-ribose pyranose/furanose isomerase RbsD